MKYILPLLLISTPIVAEINEDSLINYLHDKIDQSSYQCTHTTDPLTFYYYEGYMDAMTNVLFMIENEITH